VLTESVMRWGGEGGLVCCMTDPAQGASSVIGCAFSASWVGRLSQPPLKRGKKKVTSWPEID